MKYIIVRPDGVVTDCLAEYVDGATEITDEQARVFRTTIRHDLFKYVDGELVPNEEIIPVIEQEVARLGKVKELQDLEIQVARAMLWLVKLLLQKGVIAPADIPQPLRDLRTRIEALQSELGT